jgi:acetylornithine deacetylase
MSKSRDLLAALVAFDTTSRESNLALIEFVRDYLAQFDVPCELIYNDERSKANLFATDRPGRSSGHRAVRAYRCGAGGRSALDAVAVRAQ